MLLLLRHASAGDRDDWDGDDRERPLDQKGRAQAAALVRTLAPYRVTRILSSPAWRCLESVAPIAASRGLLPELREELAEERHGEAGHELVRSLAGEDVLVCGHGGLEDVLPEHPRWKKGTTFVVDASLRVVEVIAPTKQA